MAVRAGSVMAFCQKETFDDDVIVVSTAESRDHELRCPLSRCRMTDPVRCFVVSGPSSRLSERIIHRCVFDRFAIQAHQQRSPDLLCPKCRNVKLTDIYTQATDVLQKLESDTTQTLPTREYIDLDQYVDLTGEEGVE